MNFVQIHTIIPNTAEAKEAINLAINKVMRAHGANGNEYFEVIEIPAKEAISKDTSTLDKPKAKRGRKPKDKSASDEKSTINEPVQPIEDKEAD